MIVVVLACVFIASIVVECGVIVYIYSVINIPFHGEKGGEKDNSS